MATPQNRDFPLSKVPWYVPAIAIAAVVCGTFIWTHASGPGAHAGTDYHAYLTGARQVATGQNPYHVLVAQQVDGTGALNAHGYVYPPLLALLLAIPVLMGLPDTQIWLLWSIVNVAAVIWMGWELQHFLGFSRRPLALDAATRRWYAWAMTLCFATAALFPAIVTYDLWLGQADLLMAALAVGACGLWLRGHAWAAVGVLAVAIAIKPTMALILLVWLWKGDWRTALRGALVASALVAFSFVPVGFTALRDYITFFLHWNTFHGNAEYINQSPYGMLLRLFTSNPYTQPLFVAAWLVTPLRLVAVVGAIWLWLRAVPRQPATNPAIGLSETLLALPLIILLSPLAEDIHYCLLAPTLLGLAWLAWQRGLWHRPATWVLWATLAVSCIPRMQEIIYPLRFVPFPGQSDPRLAPWIGLLRSGALLYTAIAALVAGGEVIRAARGMVPPLPNLQAEILPDAETVGPLVNALP